MSGRHPVAEAIEHTSMVTKVHVAEGLRSNDVIERIVAAASAKSIPLGTASREQLDAMTGGANHQGVAAEVEPFRYGEASELFALEREPRLILLDGVTDPVNVGSILRTSEAFGWNGMLIPRQRSAPMTPTVRRVASGAAEVVPVAQVGSPAEAILRMKKKGIRVVGLDPSGPTRYWEAGLEAPVCLVLGAEGRGLSRLVRDRCDDLVSIPMIGRLASINVAIAAAVVMVEVTRDLAARHPVQR